MFKFTEFFSGKTPPANPGNESSQSDPRSGTQEGSNRSTEQSGQIGGPRPLERENPGPLRQLRRETFSMTTFPGDPQAQPMTEAVSTTASQKSFGPGRHILLGEYEKYNQPNLNPGCTTVFESVFIDVMNEIRDIPISHEEKVIVAGEEIEVEYSPIKLERFILPKINEFRSKLDSNDSIATKKYNATAAIYNLLCITKPQAYKPHPFSVPPPLPGEKPSMCFKYLLEGIRKEGKRFSTISSKFRWEQSTYKTATQ